MRLLLLEDDATLGDGLSAFLRCEGHSVDWFTRLDQVQALGEEPYDALLVDWGLPDGSSLGWISALRRRGHDTPIIVLTAREWSVLEALVLRSGRLVSKSDLEALVHGFQSETQSNALEVHISHLRRKLGRALIQTVHGRGYRLAN